MTRYLADCQRVMETQGFLVVGSQQPHDRGDVISDEILWVDGQIAGKVTLFVLGAATFEEVIAQKDVFGSGFECADDNWPYYIKVLAE